MTDWRDGVKMQFVKHSDREPRAGYNFGLHIRGSCQGEGNCKWCEELMRERKTDESHWLIAAIVLGCFLGTLALISAVKR